MGRKLVCLFVLAGSLALCGCQHYEYRLVQPAHLAQPIGKADITVPYPPLDYHFARDGDSLRMRVVNPTSDPITLLSGKSYVVDPAGETHPVHGRTIAPHSYVGMFLPPTPRYYDTGYYSGYAVGYGYYNPYFLHSYFGPPFYYPYADPFFYGPAYSYQVTTPYDWEWREGEVRLKLEYERAGTNFVHDFTLERRKVK